MGITTLVLTSYRVVTSAVDSAALGGPGSAQGEAVDCYGRQPGLTDYYAFSVNALVSVLVSASLGTMPVPLPQLSCKIYRLMRV